MITLIHFKCIWDGKVGCEWKAIVDNECLVHTFGKRSHGSWTWTGLMDGDDIIIRNRRKNVQEMKITRVI